MTRHMTARCETCGATWDGEQADTQAHRHTTTKAKGADRHPTISSTHDTRDCGTWCGRKDEA